MAQMPKGKARPPARPIVPPRATASSSVQPSAPQQTISPDITNIQNYHDEAFLYIEQGLSCQEVDKNDEALVLYRKGVRCITSALAISTVGMDKQGSQWDKARTYQTKMEKTKLQVNSTIDELLKAGKKDVKNATIKDEAAYVALGDSIFFDEERRMSTDAMTNAMEIFSISEGVQIFFITPDGVVSAPSYPSSLGIYQMRANISPESVAANTNTPPAFISVGNWTYPLFPGKSPALHSNTGTYLFPDVNSPNEGATVGIIIPETIPNNEKIRFQEMLKFLTDLREAKRSDSAQLVPHVEEPTEQPGTEHRKSTQIAKGLVTAAEWISWGLNKGAEKTGKLIKKGSSRLREHITPESTPHVLDPRLEQGIIYARKTTKTAVIVSGAIVDGLRNATIGMAQYIAPTIRSQGEKYLPHSLTQSEGGGQSKLEAVAEVAIGGLAGFSTVWLGLESAAKVLGTNIKNETVAVVKHKYGDSSATSTDHAMHAVGNIAMTAYTVENLGIKAIVKRTARDTGAAVLEDYRQQKDIQKPSPQQDLLPNEFLPGLNPKASSSGR